MTVVKKEAIKNVKNNENLRTTAGAGEDGKNLRINLTQVLCIQYFIAFWKKFVLALFDLGNKINTIYPTFAKELGLFI